MSPPGARPVLLTGAAGALGRVLARGLGAAGFTLRLTDKAAFPDALPAGASFAPLDLAAGTGLAALAEGCGTILHFGGISTNQPFETVIGPNIVGLHHVYEAARLATARVVFASSNHAVGFHPRRDRLDADCALRPDSFYGVSKVFGEMIGRLYWDKHGVESVIVRIGSCFPEVADARMLSTWLSPDDLVRLAVAAVTAPAVGCAIVWGASANAATFWGKDDRDRIGWTPQDSADPQAPRVREHRSGDAVAEHYQGGVYAAADFSRTLPR